MTHPKASPDIIGVATSMTVTLSGIVFGVLLWIGVSAGLLGVWLIIVVAPGFVSYLHSVATATAAGKREPPPVAITQFNAVNVVAQLLHALLFALAVAWLARANWPVRAAIVPVLAVLPASFLLFAATGSLSAASTPAQVYRLVRAMGIDYAKLLALTIAALVVSGLAVQTLTSLLAYVVASYAAFSLAATGGHLLYRRRDALDLPIITIDEKRERNVRLDENRQWQSVMDEAYQLLRAGETAKSYKLLREQIERDGGRADSYEAVYAGVRTWRMEHHTSQVARPLVDCLVAENQLQRALEVAEERLRHDAAFRPAPAACIRLAAFARSIGHVATADLLVLASSPPVEQG